MNTPLSQQPTAAAILVACAIAAVLLLLALWVHSSLRAARRRSDRLRVAAVAELDARRLLEARGWEVLEVQPSCVWSLRLDEEVFDVVSRADFLVRREGRLLIADAKSGERAPDPRLPATRRQLLEYLHVFEVDGVLLVDPERNSIVEVTFGWQTR